MRRAGRGLRFAISLLTVWPVRGPRDVTPEDGRAAMLFAPMVGVLLWVPADAVAQLTLRWLHLYFAYGQLVPAVMAVATVAVLTRGLHLDGLADTFDGLGSFRPPEQAREVMRRSDIGAMGLAAVVLVLLLQVALLDAAISDHHGTVSLLVAVSTGRLAMLAACVHGSEPAPGSRLGATVVGTVPRLWATGVGVLTVGACVLGAQLDKDTRDRGFETVTAVVAPLLGLAVAYLVVRHARRRLGGVGGDALGAICELATTVALFVMAGQPK